MLKKRKTRPTSKVDGGGASPFLTPTQWRFRIGGKKRGARGVARRAGYKSVSEKSPSEGNHAGRKKEGRRWGRVL